jgi:hypothetical protein
MQAEIQSEINQIIQTLQESPLRHWDFWLASLASISGIVLSAVGLKYSVKAFREAEKAKEEAEKATLAAKEAGKTVRVQTVAIELADIAQKLGHIQQNISFMEARELLGDATRRLRRAVAPFADDLQLKEPIAAVKQTLEAAQASLQGVRPATAEAEADAPNAVYNGVEADFGKISYTVAELSGLFERETFNRG